MPSAGVLRGARQRKLRSGSSKAAGAVQQLTLASWKATLQTDFPAEMPEDQPGMWQWEAELANKAGVALLTSAQLLAQITELMDSGMPPEGARLVVVFVFHKSLLQTWTQG